MMNMNMNQKNQKTIKTKISNSSSEVNRLINSHKSGSKENKQNVNVKNTPDIRRVFTVGKKSGIGITVIVVLVVATFFVWQFIDNINQKGEKVTLGEITAIVEKGEYEKLIERDGYVILETKLEDGEKVRQYAQYKEIAGQSYYDSLASRGVEVVNYNYEPTSQITFNDVFLMVIFAIGIWLLYKLVSGMQSSSGQLMNFGRSKARLIFGKKIRTQFEDVAGIDDAKEELVEVVDFLQHPKKYISVGARIPKGVLLVGAPGTGKTMLAKAVAGEAGVPFFHTSGSEFEEMLVGAGASRVRDLFVKAKNVAPCIVFIDEIDAIAKKRGTTTRSGYTEQTLNQILVEMDGLEEHSNVIILAATNRPDILDTAILRPGRFDRTVVVQMPDREGRMKILKVHSKGKTFAEDVDMELISKKTVGYSGADLENLLNEAAIMCAKDNRKKIVQADLMESYLKVKLGRQKKKKRVEDDVKRIAYHEAGHAIVAQFTPQADPVEKISIISRGYTGGVTVSVPKDDSEMITESQMLAQIQVAVGGKIAEEMFLREVSTGPAADIKEATKLAHKMIKRYGMNNKLGFVQYGDDNESMLGYQYESLRSYSEYYAKLIDDEVKKMMDSAISHATEILKKQKDKVKKLVEMLLKSEVIDREEFESLWYNGD